MLSEAQKRGARLSAPRLAGARQIFCFQPNDFRNDGNRRRSRFDGILWDVWQVTRQKCRARTKPLESIRKAGLGS
jgi:hypothetical protein